MAGYAGSDAGAHRLGKHVTRFRSGAEVRAPEGPPPGPEADPNRTGGHRRRRDTGLPSGLRRRGRRGRPGGGCDDRIAKDGQAAGLLLIRDANLTSYTSVWAMIASGTGFIAPAAKTYTPAATLAAPDLGSAIEVDYVAQRDACHRRTTRPVARHRGHHDAGGQTQTGPCVHTLTGVRALHRPGTRCGHRAGQETRPRPRRPSTPATGTGLPALPRRESRDRPDHRDRLRPPRRRLPPYRDRHRSPTGKPSLRWWFDQVATAGTRC